MENLEQRLKKFMECWGYDAQARMAIEEMSELTKALCKYERFGKENAPQAITDNTLEEPADVHNMIAQLEMYFGKEEIEKIRLQKIERTEKLLNN